MKTRDADKVIQHLAYHCNGYDWQQKRGVYRYKSNRVYCTERALAAAEIIGKQSGPVPEVVYRKLHRDQLAAHVIGKVVCTSDCTRHAIGFDLQFMKDDGTKKTRPDDYVVVRIEKFGHILDVEQAFDTAIPFASEVHARVGTDLRQSGECGDEGEHIVVLAQNLTDAHVVYCSNAEYFHSLPKAQQKAIRAFAKQQGNCYAQSIKKMGAKLFPNGGK